MSPPNRFVLDRVSGSARAGRLSLAHGEVPTPMFMPVGTYGAVKALSPRELAGAGARMLLGNTYHLWLRPGPEVISAHGGLQRFMGWNGPVLTDSGGFQVFSLASLSQLSDEGVVFRSPVDGSLRHLTPEEAMAIQAAFGSDIAMALDHCPPGDAPRELMVAAMDRTTRWAVRCLAVSRAPGQQRFGIVQGGPYIDLRRRHIDEIAALDFDGLALGGFSVGEPVELMYEVLADAAGRLPADHPRYLMGVGTPLDILHAISVGIDLFDCVLPTRNARNGQLFTSQGRLVIGHARYRDDLSPVDPACACETCRGFSRSYLRHLAQCREILFARLATLHNLTFYFELVSRARQAILEDRFAEFAREFRARFS